VVDVGDVGCEACGCVGVCEEADVGKGVAEGFLELVLGIGMGRELGCESTVWEEYDGFGVGVVGWFGNVGW
jgi:hypothetical protein